MEPSTRKVVTRSPTHTVRVLHLPHLQPEPIHADSNPERFFVQIAALYPNIRSIKHQPFRLTLGEKSYTPDFCLTFLDGSRLVVEVKPADRTDEYLDLFDQARAKLQLHGMGFFVARDVDITRDKLSARALRIRRYCKTRFDAAYLKTALDAVRAQPGGISMHDLTQGQGIKTEALLHLIGFKQICSRIALDIRPQAILIPVEQFREETHHAAKTYAIQFTEWFDPEDWGENDRADSAGFR